jgi:hypothetical protein
LADIKLAQQLLDDMPKTDSLKAIQELSEWIEAIREEAKDFRLDHQWAVLRMFDQAAQPHLRKLMYDYFSAQPVSKFQENRLWSLIDTYYTQSDLCHHDVYTRYLDGAKGAAAFRTELPLLCTRGIAAIIGRLKMVAAHYALVEPVLWQRLAAYYSMAETNGFLLDPVTAYSGVNTSVAQEFAQLMTWYGSGSGTLSPLHGHITERIFAYLGKGLQIGKSYSGIALFVFDTTQPTPPMRANVEATIHPALRYIDAEVMRPQLEALIKTLDKGIIPDSLNLYGAKYEVELVRGIAKRMTQSIAVPAPTRRNPRRKINVSLKVANGFYKMLEQTDVGLNFNADEIDTWEVEDISATGFRSVVQLSRVDSIKIGSLVGSRPESVSHWGAGVVRRLSRDADGNLHIGVEVLSSRIVGVPLVDRSKSGAESYLIGIYLSRTADTSGEAWLLMKPETFAANRSLTMQLDDKDYLLLPLALVEHGEDYDLARYRMMEQDVGGEE